MSLSPLGPDHEEKVEQLYVQPMMKIDQVREKWLIQKRSTDRKCLHTKIFLK